MSLIQMNLFLHRSGVVNIGLKTFSLFLNVIHSSGRSLRFGYRRLVVMAHDESSWGRKVDAVILSRRKRRLLNGVELLLVQENSTYDHESLTKASPIGADNGKPSHIFTVFRIAFFFSNAILFQSSRCRRPT